MVMVPLLVVLSTCKALKKNVLEQYERKSWYRYMDSIRQNSQIEENMLFSVRRILLITEQFLADVCIFGTNISFTPTSFM